MALEPEFRRFYRSNPVVTTLNFGIPGVHPITPAGFRLLADILVGAADNPTSAQLQRSFRVRAEARHVEPGNEAQYYFAAGVSSGGFDVPGDTLFVRSTSIFRTVFGRAVAYHESIHALLDAYGADIRRRDNEGVAHLGEALFYLACGFDENTPPAGLSTDRLEIFHMLDDVFPVARAVRSRMSGGSTAMATEDERATLRAAMADLGIRGNFTDLNGIRGRRIHNGAW